MPNVYIDYPYESVAFRTNEDGKQCFVKFYGGQEKPLNPKSDLIWHALRSPDFITQAEYEAK